MAISGVPGSSPANGIPTVTSIAKKKRRAKDAASPAGRLAPRIEEISKISSSGDKNRSGVDTQVKKIKKRKVSDSNPSVESEVQPEKLTEERVDVEAGEGDEAPLEEGEKKKKKKAKFSIEKLEGGVAQVEGIMSDSKFSSLNLSPPSIQALQEDMKFELMTEVWCGL